MSHSNRRSRDVNEFLRTGFANSGRIAGSGILYDRYDEESGNRNWEKRGKMMTPCDYMDEETLNARMNGPVEIYKMINGIKTRIR